ncbi:MAG: hypothetical protein ACR2FY_05200 [Pirellulaceae bacterium]
MTKKRINRYQAIIERIFLAHHREGVREFIFERSEIEQVAKQLRVQLPKNLGDVIYSARYRSPLPESVIRTAPTGHEWVIRAAGRGRYEFSLTTQARITPNQSLVAVKILDATPGIIDRYALQDEQALLAKVRYNRLIDVFSGVVCYSLQNHLRTTAAGLGQVEIDELYVGVDRHGAQYVFPVQAKTGRDQINVVQIEQDLAVCANQFANLVCRPIAAQFMERNLIALFELVKTEGRVLVLSERHYRLVSSDQLSDEELQLYRTTRSTE